MPAQGSSIQLIRRKILHSKAIRFCDVPPIIFDGEERVVQNIDLIKGWNWISYNVASELFSDPTSILNKAIFTGDEQVKDETNGVYMTYDGIRKQWVNNDPAQVLKFDNRHMFLLQSPMTQKLSVSGLAIHEKENLTLDILPELELHQLSEHRQSADLGSFGRIRGCGRRYHQVTRPFFYVWRNNRLAW